MSRILGEMSALFFAISGALYYYNCSITALIFLCFAVLVSFATLLTIKNDLKKSKTRKSEINLQEFTFVKDHYIHPKYPNQKICPACLISKGRVSLISNGYCTVCKQLLSGTKGEVFTIDDYE